MAKVGGKAGAHDEDGQMLFVMTFTQLRASFLSLPRSSQGNVEHYNH